MLRLSDIEANPDFRNRPYGEQQRIRDAWVNDVLLKSPEYQAAPHEMKVRLLDDVQYRAPVFADPSHPAVQEAMGIAARAAAGDQEALADAKNRVLQHEATKDSFIQNIGLRTLSGITSLLYGKNSDVAAQNDYETTYGAEGQKINSLLAQSIARSDPEGFSSTMGGAAIGSFLVQALDFSAQMAAGAGELKAGAAAAGLLSRGVEARVAAFAERMPFGVVQRTVQALGSHAPEALFSSALIGAETVLTDSMRDGPENPSFSRIAEDFGRNIAFDYALWGSLKAMKTSYKALRFILTDPAKTAAVQAAAQGVTDDVSKYIAAQYLKDAPIDTAVMANLPREAQDLLLNEAAKKHAVEQEVRAGTPDGRMHVLANACGFDVVYDPAKRFFITTAQDSDAQAAFKTREEVLQYTFKNRFEAPKASIGDAPTGAIRGMETIKLGERLEPKAYAPLLDSITEPNNAKFVYESLSAKLGTRVKVRPVVEDSLFEHHMTIDSETGKPVRLGDANGKLHSGDLQNMMSNVEGAFNRALDNGELLVPSRFDNALQEQAYFGMLRRAVERRAPDLDEARTMLKDVAWTFRRSTSDARSPIVRATHTATERLAKALYNDKDVYIASRGDGSFSVMQRPRGATSYSEVLSAPNDTELRSSILGRMVENGTLTDDNIAIGARMLSGMEVRVPGSMLDRGVGKVQRDYSISSRTGRFERHYDSMKDLLADNPEVLQRMALPDKFGPSAYVIDPEAAIVRFEGNVAIGPASELMQLAHSFTDGESKDLRLVEIAHAEPGSLEHEPLSQSYLYTPFEGGRTRYYPTVAELKADLARRVRNTDALKDEANARGYAAVHAPDGSVVFTNGKEDIRFTTFAEVRQWMKDNPLPKSAPELMDRTLWDDEQLKLIDLEAKQAVQRVRPLPERNTIRNGWNLWQRALNNPGISMFIRQSDVTFALIEKRTGIYTIRKTFQNIKDAMRLVGVANQKYIAPVEQIWKGVRKTRAEQLATFLKVDESRWPTMAKVTDTVLTQKEIESLRAHQRLFTTFLTAEGVTDGSSFFARASEVQAKIASLRADAKEIPKTLDEVIKEQYGRDVPQVLKLFSHGMTTRDFLDLLDHGDPVTALLTTIDHVHKQKYFGAIRDDIAHTYMNLFEQSLQGAIDKGELKFFENTLNEIMGHKSDAALKLEKASHVGTHALFGWMKRVPWLNDSGVADEFLTDDILGKMGQIFNNNTQAFRLFVAPRNLTQLAFAGAITGNAQVVRSFSYVLNHPEYIESLLRRGAIERSIYESGTEGMTAIKRFWHVGLAPLEKSEILNRATVIHAAEDSIERAGKRYRAGYTSTEQFIRECNADWMPESDQRQFLETFKVNEKRAADYYGMKLNILTMGDYTRAAQGKVFRGVIGKVFGKLGVYPATVLNQYLTMLTTGSVATRAARAARVVATTSAIYTIFRYAGINYPGFLAIDALGFSGGPLWSTLNDALNSPGDRPENQLARAHLARNIPQGYVPLWLLGRYAGKAAQYYQSGEYYKALLSLWAAPVDTEGFAQ
jgi:hypothetical protein